LSLIIRGEEENSVDEGSFSTIFFVTNRKIFVQEEFHFEVEVVTNSTDCLENLIEGKLGNTLVGGNGLKISSSVGRDEILWEVTLSQEGINIEVNVGARKGRGSKDC